MVSWLACLSFRFTSRVGRKDGAWLVMPRYERGWSERCLKRLGTGWRWRWRGWLALFGSAVAGDEDDVADSDAVVGIDDSEWRPGS
jgi:hypothetical protein